MDFDILGLLVGDGVIEILADLDGDLVEDGVGDGDALIEALGVCTSSSGSNNTKCLSVLIYPQQTKCKTASKVLSVASVIPDVALSDNLTPEGIFKGTNAVILG